MANVTAIQILQDGPRNLVVKLTGILDTSDVSLSTLIDVATLSAITDGGQLPTRVIIDKVSYNIEAGLAVNLYWDATTDVLIDSFVNSGDDLYAQSYGGLWNNSGTGITGNVLYSTQGWSAGATLSFNLILECRKR